MPIITVKGKTNRTFTFSPLEVDEFLPLVEIVPEKVKDVQNNTFEIKGDELAPTETQVTLSKHLDADKRSYILQELTTDKTTLELEFKVTKGSTDTWDDDGYIEPKLSITDPGIRITSATKLKQKYGNTFQLTLDIDSKETKTFYIDFFANDNEDDFNKGEYENVFCGRVQIVYEVPNAREFRKEKIDEIIAYAKENNRKCKGLGDANRSHHYTDTHKQIVYKLLNTPEDLNLGKDQDHSFFANRLTSNAFLVELK